MATLVARMVKMKAGNLHGMQRHNQRETQAHSNKEIDIEKSQWNYDLVNESSINYKDKVHEIIDEQRTSEKTIRKDAVLCDEWIITSQKNFFDEMYPNDMENFFKTTCDYFKKRCGSQNMVYATVHMDETTPHMHLGIIPMIDGRLSSKEVFSRAHLLEIQNELPKYLQSCGFKNIHRGQEESKRKHLSVPEYKDVHNKTTQLKKEYDKGIENLRELSTMNDKIDDDILRKIKQYGAIEETINVLNTKHKYPDWAQENILPLAKEKLGFDKKKKYIFSEEDMEQICKKVNDLNYLSCSNDDLLKNNKKLIQENCTLNSSIPDLINKRTNEVSLQNEKLKKDKESFSMAYESAADTQKKVIKDCKKIIANTELYLDKYLHMDEIDIEAYRCYLGIDKEIELPMLYELNGMGSGEVVDEAINIYEKVNLNNHKFKKEKNINNELENDNSNLNGYSKYNDFELEI